MSYYAHSCTSDCVIPAENIPRLLEAYNEYVGKEDVPRANTIEDIFDHTGFAVESMSLSRSQNMTLWYEHSPWHSEDVEFLFDIIAPFVKPGSYISFQGEDDNTWAYYFDGKSWEEYYGMTCFPGMPSELQYRALDAGSSIEDNLAVIFGPALAAQLPKELIDSIKAVNTPSSLEAISQTLFDVIMQKTSPASPLQEGFLHSLMMEDVA